MKLMIVALVIALSSAPIQAQAWGTKAPLVMMAIAEHATPGNLEDEVSALRSEAGKLKENAKRAWPKIKRKLSDLKTKAHQRIAPKLKQLAPGRDVQTAHGTTI